MDDVRVRGTASSGMSQEEPQPISEGPPQLEMVRISPFSSSPRLGSHKGVAVYSLALAPWALAVHHRGPSLHRPTCILCECRTALLFSILGEGSPVGDWHLHGVVDAAYGILFPNLHDAANWKLPRQGLQRQKVTKNED